MMCCVAGALIETDRERGRQNGSGPLPPPPAKTPSPPAEIMQPMNDLLTGEVEFGLMGEDRCDHCS